MSDQPPLELSVVQRFDSSRDGSRKIDRVNYPFRFRNASFTDSTSTIAALTVDGSLLSLHTHEGECCTRACPQRYQHPSYDGKPVVWNQYPIYSGEHIRAAFLVEHLPESKPSAMEQVSRSSLILYTSRQRFLSLGAWPTPAQWCSFFVSSLAVDEAKEVSAIYMAERPIDEKPHITVETRPANDICCLPRNPWDENFRHLDVSVGILQASRSCLLEVYYVRRTPIRCAMVGNLPSRFSHPRLVVACRDGFVRVSGQWPSKSVNTADWDFPTELIRNTYSVTGPVPKVNYSQEMRTEMLCD